MTPTVPGATSRPRETWKNLYNAALFETDRAKTPLRIADAEKAILARLVELTAARHDHIEEDSILDDALYALHALRNSVSGSKAA